MEMPDEIMEYLQKKDAREINLVEFNERKGRYCYSFRLNDRKYFLKWNDKDPAHEKFRLLLQNEIRVYSLLKEEAITPASQSDVPEDMLVMEFLPDAVTLRKCLKECGQDPESVKKVIEDVFSAWYRGVRTLGKAPEEEEAESDYSLFDRYLYSLLCSGPFEMKQRKAEWYRNRAIRKVMSKKAAKCLKQREEGEPSGIHGDFHANNVLISKGRCCLIDLENAGIGCPDIEMAYLYAQLKLLLRDQTEIIRWMNHYLESMISDRQLFRYCAKVYYRAIRLNHRFY
ncbi:MAG: aminoglycoside phosphotransferase family protein [Eubacterium sp.]|nr:aminoglycoside phosphotransferase family protein [Eubacterium sp.]